ncbi:LINE-1 retrotransposable element ORF1 protein [Labeo rohita]|uniref:LINE-1 retrotransposable element ORF1 protein n=1 Tax=Labeo rohita TaxID=84645 RepID=A0ABQ8MKB9_LABRO|nr:LINE-1 retrotransposable element ORF1 protein [Labeo rohita]
MKKAKLKKGDSPTSSGKQPAEKPPSNESEADDDIRAATDSTVILSAIQTMSNINKALCAKLDDLEGRSRRANIKIVGLPENVEAGRPTEFVEQLIPKLLGTENFPERIKVDHAHSTGPLPSRGGRPRIMIARIHHYPVKETILRLTRQHGPLKFDGVLISIFPDFTAECVVSVSFTG